MKARYALCIDSRDEVDLDVRKVYRVVSDDEAARTGLVRIVDESGEDYLYSAALFIPLPLNQSSARIVNSLG